MIRSAIVCTVLAVVGLGVCAAGTPEKGGDKTGPTILMDYGSSEARANSAEDFMYFVPLVSMTPIWSETSKPNSQRARLTSFAKTVEDGAFVVSCEFEMTGKGLYRSTFEPVAMIETYAKIRKTETLTSMLDYIKLDAEGKGSIEVSGRIVSGKEVVDDVKVHFNRGNKSPVRIEIYSVQKTAGKFDYAKRYNRLVARVNSLSFRRTDRKPAMYVTVASITKAGKNEGLLQNIIGAVASLFIPPVEIDLAGNNAMLDFGKAVSGKEASFTFPLAGNLIPNPADETAGLQSKE
jgi:hypothetical protein